MSGINWTNVTVKLGDLKPWAENPRLSTKNQAERILRSFADFGQVQTIAVSPSLKVLDGHQRLSALLTLHGKDYEIDARQSSRELTNLEQRALVLSLHAGATGQWNWDSLSNWDATFLQDFGLDDDYFKQLQTDTAALLNLFDSEWEGDDAENYTRKIEPPTYIPTGNKPTISELFDNSKTLALIEAISTASIPEDEKEFLKIAAQRHTVFNFRNIAEYYAHSSQELQDLFENSALVIIDFDKAIELGFVNLTERLLELVGKQNE